MVDQDGGPVFVGFHRESFPFYVFAWAEAVNIYISLHGDRCVLRKVVRYYVSSVVLVTNGIFGAYTHT